MDADRFAAYIVGIFTGFFMSAVVFIAAHIENGLLFFLVAFPSTVGLYWLGLVALNIHKEQ